MTYKNDTEKEGESNDLCFVLSRILNLIRRTNISLCLVGVYRQFFTGISIREIFRTKFFDSPVAEITGIAFFTRRKSNDYGCE